MAFSRPNANTSKQCQYFKLKTIVATKMANATHKICVLIRLKLAKPISCAIWNSFGSINTFHKRRQATKEGAENNPDKQQEENILVFFLKQEVIKH